MNNLISTKDFNHKYQVTVRFHEVDMLGVCYNAVYINYFETARLEYAKAVGLIPPKGIFSDGKIFFIVRNEINYRGFAHHDDVLEVYSKISFIKNSSFGYDHLIVNQKSGKVIVDGKVVIVHVDLKTRKSRRLSDDFIRKVKKYEPSVKILRE
jgi:acyl-CoA thioester hydrolase